jgi:hypothetical protein
VIARAADLAPSERRNEQPEGSSGGPLSATLGSHRPLDKLTAGSIDEHRELSYRVVSGKDRVAKADVKRLFDAENYVDVCERIPSGDVPWSGVNRQSDLVVSEQIAHDLLDPLNRC